ncbi:epoxide hydrolase [Arthrobacter sp. ATA002]|uniref:epoxide hydrolase family protein n=1 Tax=Arthrobacter sp. ATA002 TaxID=2991715 RepID=UPI0022A7BC1D|nr:epoxide hydrolase [Arthrobacter sp. ATA002]WAP50782.1 epoxide hydrolase [Arthrobacter sp. ATA002]
MSINTSITPYTLHIPQTELDDLKQRLVNTRWPDRETVGDTSQGPQLYKIKALVEHWATSYDWRQTEALLNGWGQYTTTIDGLNIHFLHIRSAVPEARPLLLTHGWPGSVLEFRHVVGPLTDPEAYGGAAEDAFHLVIPSLPGFGFSGKPTEPGWNLNRTAKAWATLMQRLGYTNWFAQEGTSALPSPRNSPRSRHLKASASPASTSTWLCSCPPMPRPVQPLRKSR